MRMQENRTVATMRALALCALSFVLSVGLSQAAEPDQTRLLDLISAGETEPSIALVENTSKTLLKSGLIDFPLSIELDLPVDAQHLSLDEALAPYSNTEPRFALVFEVAQAKARRRVVSLKPVPSTVFLGFSGQPYAVAADDPIARQSFAETGYNAKAQAYATTPQALGAPLVFDYAFDTAEIQARRSITVNTYMIDRKARTYVASAFDASEERNFKVAYRVSKYDPKRSQHEDAFEREADVDEFEKDGFGVPLSALLKDYAEKRDQAQPFENEQALRLALLKDRNENLQTVHANTFDARPLNDSRFDSVVAIYTGKGALGSGFFVTPDVVMTNWHVVGEHRFVEMKMYDGRETFGSVLGKDARLDIALVRVQDRGRPVAFYTGRSIDLGQNVEAIGHPHRQEFSVTRGIISAVRKASSINMPKGAGDKVLYIQTDTPINPGNSGGPLFLNQRVVGMNTWGYVPGYADGLNFSVHYSELMNFMNEHLPEYFVSPAGEN